MIEQELEFRAHGNITRADYDLIASTITGCVLLAYQNKHDELEEVFRIAMDESFDVTENGVEDLPHVLAVTAMASIGYATILRYVEDFKQRERDDESAKGETGTGPVSSSEESTD